MDHCGQSYLCFFTSICHRLRPKFMYHPHASKQLIRESSGPGGNVSKFAIWFMCCSRPDGSPHSPPIPPDIFLCILPPTEIQQQVVPPLAFPGIRRKFARLRNFLEKLCSLQRSSRGKRFASRGCPFVKDLPLLTLKAVFW